MKVYVTTTLRQEVEVPEGTDKQDVYNFLAEHQSFRDAFCGVSTDLGMMRITDIEQLYIEGYGPKSIAVQLECPIETVYKWIKENGCSGTEDLSPFETINS